jgi:hypothetical protein
MSITQSMQYFTSSEVCSVFTARRQEVCQERFGIQNTTTTSLMKSSFCSVSDKGVGWVNHVCPNLSGTIFRFSLSTDSPSNERTIIDFIMTAVYHGYDTLLLIGDSITVQHYYDLYCQLLRYGEDEGLTIQMFGLTMYINNIDKYLEKHRIPYFEEQQRRKEEKEYNRSSSTKKEEKRRGNDTAVSSSASSPYSSIKFTTFVIRYFRAYIKVSETIESFLGKQSDASVIILFNLGLHFNSNISSSDVSTVGPRELQTVYNNFFGHSLNTLIKKHQQIVFFRETSAQHFPTINGAFDSHNFSTNFKYDSREDPVKQLYDKNVADAGSVGGAGQQVMTNQENAGADVDLIDKRFPHKAFFTECVPILTKEQYDSQNWRNKLAEKVLSEIDPNHQEIPIIPFYQ